MSCWSKKLTQFEISCYKYTSQGRLREECLFSGKNGKCGREEISPIPPATVPLSKSYPVPVRIPPRECEKSGQEART
uniref:Uncharacterized protein n=1 Tax=Romanomermis culicivorax TaxID=13658 RepID=A0A915IJR2_ROMCU